MWHIAWAIHRSSSPHLLLYPGTTPAHVGKLACNRQPREQDMSPPPCYAMLHTRTHGCSGSTKKSEDPCPGGGLCQQPVMNPAADPAGARWNACAQTCVEHAALRPRAFVASNPPWKCPSMMHAKAHPLPTCSTAVHLLVPNMPGTLGFAQG